ncbi:MAG: hypothetical protein IT167_15470, partial [Bryobacterales bacterium]|nr:hypothetical protein [Bryobacterales bacterium]
MRVIITMLLVAAVAPAEAPPERTAPAVNQVEVWRQVGQQPYEFTWTQREEDPRTLTGFENLEGWRLEMYDGAEGELRRSREQQMWGQYVAKFVFSGKRAESRVVARPPKPVPIPGSFDSIDLWGYGNRWSWVPDKTTPPADVSILVSDARGKEFKIQL